MDDQTLKAAIQLEIKETEPCVRELALTVPAATVDAELNDQLRLAARSARLPGFRPGKAPLPMVRNHFGKHVAGEVVRRCHGVALLKAVEDEKLDVLSYPHPPADDAGLPAGQDYAFTMTVNVAPEFDLPEYRGLKLQFAEQAVADEEIESGIARFRETHAEFGMVDGLAADGDMLKLTYTSDLALPPDASEDLAKHAAAADTWCWLSEPEMLPGMIAGLTGVKAGETRELDITFPADFRDQEIAGRTAHYRFEIQEVHRRQPITDDDALCRRMGVADLAELRQRLRETRGHQERMRRRDELLSQATAAVCGPLREIPLPPMLVDEAANKEFRNLANRAVNSEAEADEFIKHQERHLAEARTRAAERLRQFFVFRRIAREENIQVTESEVTNRMQAIGRAYGIGDKELHQRMAANGGLEDLHVDMLMDKVAEFLVAQATVNGEPTAVAAS